ncbi:MAG: glycerol-3-phosphate 1-O-acyltransferase [Nostocoides sp.]|uniref:glycerol-3-phosphate 1-O-acyltransferase n=1 Tax=Nostocoides sp. TaxID=1917966 RepID=UPI003C756E8A
MSDQDARSADDTRSAIVIAVTRTAVEDRLVRAKVAERYGGASGAPEIFTLPRQARATGDFSPLAARIAQGDVELIPMGVTWLPAEHTDGERRVGLRDVVRGHNPYKPTPRQQNQIARKDPDRGRVIEGASASVATLRERYAESGKDPDADSLAFARYVGRRARLALQRADAQLLGPQFKSAKLVKDEILANAHFTAGLTRIRAELGPDVVTEDRIDEILDELATGWGRFFIDVFPRVGRAVFQRGFDPKIDTVPAEIERLRATMADRPVIFLWSHRSNLDTPVLSVALHENGLPLPHMFAGINMSFGPMGSIMRRSGVIFIRRSISDPLYKFMLKEFVGYLAEKRFNLSWSIEGTRSRTGKMLPPKLGLLSFAADPYIEGRTDDIALQPVAITFDQLHEVGEYAEYARGGKKAAEGFSWLYNFIKAQGQNNYGKIYIRFPEPVSMRAIMGPPNGEIAQDDAKRRLALHKMAFEVAWRVNKAAPVTPTALVTATLLGTQGAALSAAQVTLALSQVLDYLEQLAVPLASSVGNLRTVSGVEQVLRALAASGLVTRVDGARDVVWLIEPDQQLAATFYRNSIIHVFQLGAICEIALTLAARSEPGPERLAAFWASIDRQRDLLKFDFYFQEKSLHRKQIEAQMALADPDWEAKLVAADFDIRSTLRARMPLVAPFSLRPFFESYGIVADVLAHHRGDGPIDTAAITQEALAFGEQLIAQRRIVSEEPVSALLFATGLQLAENQGVLAEGPDRTERAAAFEAEVRGIVRAIDTIAAVAGEVFAQEVRAANT